MTVEKTQWMQSAMPTAPKSVKETGIGLSSLTRLMLKAMYVRGLAYPSELSNELKLHVAVVNELLDEGRRRKVVMAVGGTALHAELKFELTDKGRNWALDALEQSQYIGPAPISLESYEEQTKKQPLVAERVDAERLNEGLEGLVVSDRLRRRLGPAINSARTILFYGHPGDGKTTIANAIGRLFHQVILIPYCLEVDGSLIKVFDPGLHAESREGGPASMSLRVDDGDRRWVRCYRPVVFAAGELTLDMLDLRFNATSKFYEAPLHMKANGGVFVIDDLGRQLVEPEDLLNRWIGPMEKRVDYLSLDTGKTFPIPFDEILIFSTNLKPAELMDPAFLRRIAYKVAIRPPTHDEFRATFRIVCNDYGLKFSDDMATFVMTELATTHGLALSFYQPKFVADQIVAACKFQGLPLEMNVDLVSDALENLSIQEIAHSKSDSN